MCKQPATPNPLIVLLLPTQDCVRSRELVLGYSRFLPTGGGLCKRPATPNPFLMPEHFDARAVSTEAATGYKRLFLSIARLYAVSAISGKYWRYIVYAR